MYPGPFVRLAVSGTLYGTEGFTFTMSLAPEDGSFIGGWTADHVPAGIVTAVQALMSSALISAPAKTTMIKYNVIGQDGRYLADTSIFHDFGTAGIAGAASRAYPPQTALAVTLATARSRGRASRGRFYLPVPNLTIQDDGRVLVTDINNVAIPTLKTFLQAVNDSAVGGDVPLRLVVASDLDAGRFEPVTAFKVGRVLDTIRSRRTSLDEAYVVPLVGAAGSAAFELTA